MKDLRTKVNKKKIKKQTNTVQNTTKTVNKIWKRCFEKNKEDERLHEQITDDNWWEFI